MNDQAWLESIRAENRKNLGLEGMNGYGDVIDAEYSMSGLGLAPGTGTRTFLTPVMGARTKGAASLKAPPPPPPPPPKKAVSDDMVTGILVGVGALALLSSLGVAKHSGKTKSQLGVLGLGLVLFAGYRAMKGR